MKVLRGGQGVSGAAGGLRQRRARARRGGYKKTRRAAPDGDDGVKRHKGVKLVTPGLALAAFHEGQLDAPPGLQFVRHNCVGAAFVLFWLLVSCLRGAASRGPARGGAARRGGGGGVGGGALPRARVLRGVLFCFGAKLCNVGCENGGNAQRPHSFGPARAEARRRARARDACRPRDSAEPSQTRPRGHPRSRGDGRAQAHQPGDPSAARPFVAGRAPGSRPPAAKRVGRPPQKPPPCQSLGTHIQAKARKSASDSLRFQYRSAATTTTRKARRTQHN